MRLPWLLAPQYEAGRQAVAAAEVAHFDESGMRINGTLNWLHVAATGTAVHYTSHPKRGREAMDAAGVLPGFQGVAVHDRWKPCRVYTRCSHALCNAHHLRELAYCEALTGHWWPVEPRRILLDAKDAVAAGQTALEPAQLAGLQARYDGQVKIGLDAWPVRPPEPGGKKGPAKQRDATNLLLRLRDYKDQVLRFLTDWRVPFDNNLAERLVRQVLRQAESDRRLSRRRRCRRLLRHPFHLGNQQAERPQSFRHPQAGVRGLVVTRRQ